MGASWGQEVSDLGLRWEAAPLLPCLCLCKHLGKFKPQRKTTTHTPMGMAQIQTLTPHAGGEDGERQGFSFIAGGNAGCGAVSYKTKHALTIRASNRTPWYLPKGAEKLRPHKKLPMNVYGSFIHKCPSLEVAQMSFSR